MYWRAKCSPHYCRSAHEKREEKYKNCASPKIAMGENLIN